jgi:hypothetical protein
MPARPRPESYRRLLRGIANMPIWRPPTALRAGQFLGGRTALPRRCVACVHSAFLRCSCAAGGATGGNPALGRSLARSLLTLKSCHHPSSHYGHRYDSTAVLRYGACAVVRRGAPRPHAGDANAITRTSVTGHGTVTQRHHVGPVGTIKRPRTNFTTRAARGRRVNSANSAAGASSIAVIFSVALISSSTHAPHP